MNQTSADEYFRLANKFFGKALELGYADLEKHFWYHTIDLGKGLITPGARTHSDGDYLLLGQSREH